MARSVVGTSQYMAPEVILGANYDGRCDWWSIGIILYECLYGRTPFYSETRVKTKECIVNHRHTLHFPMQERFARPLTPQRIALPTPSDWAVDLLRGLLCEKERRLSSRQYRHSDPRMPIRRLSASHNNPLARHVFSNDADEIKKHPWFADVPWTQMHLSTPPFIPKVKENQSITKYFEDEKDIMSVESSSFASVRDLIPDDADEGEAALVLGAHFERWKAEKIQREKMELGIDQYPDAELQRIKEHFGNRYQEWRAQRMVEIAEHMADGGHEMPLPPQQQQQRHKKERKRARDKMLRDPLMCKVVMEVRKKRAFFGYTYRRPKPFCLDGVVRYRRRIMMRPTILPVERGSEEGEEGGY